MQALSPSAALASTRPAWPLWVSADVRALVPAGEPVIAGYAEAASKTAAWQPRTFPWVDKCGDPAYAAARPHSALKAQCECGRARNLVEKIVMPTYPQRIRLPHGTAAGP